jgi:RHS repeat-associated protein
VFEEGSFRPAAKLTKDKKYSIVTDYLGTPAQMYDEKGQLVWETHLDIYGKVRTFAGRSLSDCPFRYQGQYEDAETGLYYNRFRYYSPEEGMYLSKDPIGLAGNNPTLYGYVKDVNSWVDILGLLILYHAGDLQGNIDLTKGRQNLDFNPAGKGGFYTTTDLSQAQEWVGRKGGTVTVFDVPDEKLAALKTKTFNGSTDEWADFVTKGRAGTLSHDFDAVSGPMLANPRGKTPKAKGSQFAIFSNDAAKLFDKHKVATIDCH